MMKPRRKGRKKRAKKKDQSIHGKKVEGYIAAERKGAKNKPKKD